MVLQISHRASSETQHRMQRVQTLQQLCSLVPAVVFLQLVGVIVDLELLVQEMVFHFVATSRKQKMFENQDVITAR